MGRELNELVEAWYGEIDSPSLTRAVLEAARQLAVRAASGARMSDADADEVAQHCCDKLLPYLQRERVEKAEAWVWTVALNRVRDIQRREQRTAKRDASLRGEPSYLSARSADPEEFWIAHEEVAWRRERLKEALDAAPERYRTIVTRVYLEDVAVETIADEYYQEAAAEPGFASSDAALVEVTRKRARNRADQHVKRSIAWLRDYAAKAGGQ